LKPRHAVLLAIAMSPHILCAAPAKLLDALRYEESGNKRKAMNHNKNGTHDDGPYQLNSAYLPDFEWRYNKGKKIDPFNEREARSLANFHLDCLQAAILGDRMADARFSKSGRWYHVLQAWNCGLSKCIRKAPKLSIDFALRVMRRAGMEAK
jgi:hypothetical protein